MKESKVDRRVKYTKRMLREAAIKLLKDRSIAEISVTELCKEADVNRSTFYAHYKDQFDLFEEIEDETYEELQSIILAHKQKTIRNQSTENLQYVLEYVAKNQELFQILLRDYSNGKFGKLIMQMTNGILENETAEITKSLLEYMKVFAISSSTSIIRKWLDEGMNESPEFMATFIVRLIKKGILS